MYGILEHIRCGKNKKEYLSDKEKRERKTESNREENKSGYGLGGLEVNVFYIRWCLRRKSIFLPLCVKKEVRVWEYGMLGDSVFLDRDP